MKQKYFLNFFLTGLLSLFSLCTSFGQVITTIDFETVNSGYSPSTTFGTGNTDTFNRTNIGVNGNSSYYWVAEDINNDPTIDLSQLNINGSQSFTFAIDLSYPNASQWDSTDELIITYSIDGGAYQNLMAVQHINNDPYNEPAALDLDFDGNGDPGQELSTSAFTTFTTSSISLSSNSTLDIKLQFNKLTSNGEGIFVDNIIITEAEDLPSANISYSENFSDCSTHDWTVATVGAETEWICGSGYFQANAYNSSGAADDYLISPSFDMDAQTGETLSFTSWTKYEDTGDGVQNIELLYTTNYTGDPSTTTWVNTLSPTWPVADSETNTGSGNLDISSITGSAVHFAFRYTSTGTGSGSTERWRIDDISIGGTLSVTDDQTIASDINLDVDISSTGSLTLNSNSDINGDVTIANGGELTLNGTRYNTNGCN